jgi:hypothetical protein
VSKRSIIIIFLLVLAGAAGWYAYREYNRKNADLSHTRPDFALSAVQLVREFETDDTTAARKFNGMIVEINGVVKNVETDDSGFFTVVMGDSTSLSSVRCSLDTAHKDEASLLSHGALATIRGACTGFNKDEMGLGSDVILNRCVVIPKEK